MWLTRHHATAEVTALISFLQLTGHNARLEVTILIFYPTLPKEAEDFPRGDKYFKHVLNLT